MNKTIKLSYKCLLIISILYIYIPVFIFVLGWTKLLVSIPFSLITAYIAYRIYKNLLKNKCEYININIFVLIFVTILFLIVGYFSGWGRWVNQTSDWYKHNAILEDLINKDWPVYYTNGNEHSMLSYYILQYILPSLVGKLTNLRCAEISIYIFNELGLFLIYLNLIKYLKFNKLFSQAFLGVMIIFFGTPLLLAKIFRDNFTDYQYYFYHDTFYSGTNGVLLQYTNNFALLEWVYPQVITIWLIISIFLSNKSKIEYYLFLMLPGVLYGTLSFLGLVPVAIAYAFEFLIKNKDLRLWFAKIFSFENILSILTLGLITFLYLYGNVFLDKPDSLGIKYMGYDKDSIVLYVIFILFNVLIYIPFVFKKYKNDGIFISSILMLLILPLFKMGYYNDLTMRTSIPALFILMVYVSSSIIQSFNNFNLNLKNKLISISLIILVLIGMYQSFVVDFYSCNVVKEDYTKLGEYASWGTLENDANRDVKDEMSYSVVYNYFAYDIDDNIFYKYIARNK